MMYGIYQLKKDKLADYGFESYDRVIAQHGDGAVRMDNYSSVYEFDLESTAELRLDDIYDIFNMSSPPDYHGHSLSVSDVVRIDSDFYYCDNIGWKKLDWHMP